MNDTSFDSPVKRCPKCNQVKSLAMFHRNKSTTDGLQTYCKTCLRTPAGLEAEQHRQLGLKRCVKCQEVKPFADFRIKSEKVNGYDSQCRICRRSAAGWQIEERRKLAAQGLKQCTKCGEVKPLSDYHYQKDGLGKKQSKCAQCFRTPQTLENEKRRLEIPSGMKKCRVCHEIKACELFPRHKYYKDGFDSRCKDCEHIVYQEKHRDKRLSKYHANADQMRLESRIRYHNNIERMREQAQQYRYSNIEKVRERERERSRSRYRRNPDLHHEYARQWRSANREKINIQSHNRRARIRGIGGKLTTKDLENIRVMQSGHCAYCGRTDQILTIEHIIPTTRENTSNDAWNICLACGPCNYSKQDKLLEEWVDRWYLS